jgi:hypothetical protein
LFRAVPRSHPFEGPCDVYAVGDRAPADFEVATEAARLHAMVIGEPLRMGSVPEAPPGVVFAVPAFDPKVYHPDPVSRPILGVAAFAGVAPVRGITGWYGLRVVAAKWADLLVVHLPEAPGGHEVVGRWGPFGPLPEPQGQAETVSGDMGKTWVEFRPGLYAKDFDVAEYRRAAAQRARSDLYLRSLDRGNITVRTPEEVRARVEEAMRPFLPERPSPRGD